MTHIMTIYDPKSYTLWEVRPDKWMEQEILIQLHFLNYCCNCYVYYVNDRNNSFNPFIYLCIVVSLFLN